MAFECGDKRVPCTIDPLVDGPDDIQRLIEDNGRLRECLQRAGLVAFVRSGDPEEVATHLRDVVESYHKAAQKAATERDEAWAALLQIAECDHWTECVVRDDGTCDCSVGIAAAALAGKDEK